MFATLPVLMALSWVPAAPAQPATATPAQKVNQSAQATETIKCPVTGEQVPACCCPVK